MADSKIQRRPRGTNKTNSKLATININSGLCPKNEIFSSQGNMTTPTTNPQIRKKALREQAHAARKAQENKDEISQAIVEKFVALLEYDKAKTVLYYVDVRSEVRTRHYLPTALTHGKKIVVPYCIEGNQLELFWLESMDELELGMYKILEPRADLREVPEKKVDVKELDLIMLPGVGFDNTGARMGHGKGYYDRLLEHARPDCPLVAIAFECQMFPEIPVSTHDVYMDKVITEKAIYEGKGRGQ